MDVGLCVRGPLESSCRFTKYVFVNLFQYSKRSGRGGTRGVEYVGSPIRPSSSLRWFECLGEGRSFSKVT